MLVGKPAVHILHCSSEFSKFQLVMDFGCPGVSYFVVVVVVFFSFFLGGGGVKVFGIKIQT